MELSVIESVTARRDYQQLVRARRRFSFTLTALDDRHVLRLHPARRSRRVLAVPLYRGATMTSGSPPASRSSGAISLTALRANSCVRPPRRRDPLQATCDDSLMALGAPAVLASTAAHAVSSTDARQGRTEPGRDRDVLRACVRDARAHALAARRTRSTRDFTRRRRHHWHAIGATTCRPRRFRLSGMVFVRLRRKPSTRSASWSAAAVRDVLIAEPLRNLGKFTFVDVVAYRFAQRPIRRLLTSANSLTIVVLYLVVQMVGQADPAAVRCRTARPS